MPVKLSRVNVLWPMRSLKPSLVLVACAIPLFAAAKGKDDAKPEISLELLEFLADYSDEQGQLVDPETLEPIVVAVSKPAEKVCANPPTKLTGENQSLSEHKKSGSEPTYNGQPERVTNVKQDKSSKECQLAPNESHTQPNDKREQPQTEESKRDV